MFLGLLIGLIGTSPCNTDLPFPDTTSTSAIKPTDPTKPQVNETLLIKSSIALPGRCLPLRGLEKRQEK